jgi:hypothetical protein
MNKYALIITPLILVSSAFAQNTSGEYKRFGLFLEPMITYEVGDADVDYPAPFSGSEGSADGFGVGARLGMHIWESVFIGIDGRYSKLNVKNSNPNYSTDATAYNYGPVIGVQLPTLFALRVWGSYIFDGVMDMNRDNDVDLKLGDAKGYRLGVGFKLALVSLNLEYQDIDYKNAEFQNAGIFTGSSAGLKARNQSYIFSISFPFSL